MAALLFGLPAALQLGASPQISSRRLAPPVMQQLRDATARAAGRAAKASTPAQQAGAVQPNRDAAARAAARATRDGAVQPTHRYQGVQPGSATRRQQDATTRDSEPTVVQGDSLRTWSSNQPSTEQEISLGTNGRPLDAVVEVWDNAGDTPVSMHVSSEDGHNRPVRAVIGGRGTPNSVALRNTGPMELPLAGSVVATGHAPPAAKAAARPSAECFAAAQNIQGGGMERTYRFDWTVESVQVLLRSDGMPITARIEVLQGPNTQRQVIDVYSNDGRSRPVFYMLETPSFGRGCVIEITNTGPMEYPLTASCVPHVINTDVGVFGPPGDAVVGGDDPGGYGRVRGGLDSPWNDRDTVY